MRRAPLFAALLLVWAGTASADWSVTIQGPVTITGPGAAPIVIPPPVTPPVVVTPPPLPPPPVVPPITDNSPFAFPTPQPPPESRPEARYTNICPSPSESCYASLPEFDNPASGSYALACITPPGMRFRGASVGGLRLYVPRAWGQTQPSTIRLLCAGGAV